MIIMRIVTVSVFLYLIRWLFLFILATVEAVRRRLTTSGKILTLLVGAVLCWWLVVHLADMADMAKRRLEWSVVLRRILSTLIPILFFKWLIRHFMLVASSSWQVVSDAEAEDGGNILQSCLEFDFDFFYTRQFLTNLHIKSPRSHSDFDRHGQLSHQW